MCIEVFLTKMFFFLIFLTSPLIATTDVVMGQSFSSARAVGQDILIPKCPAHFCQTKSKEQICGCDKECYKSKDCCLDALSDPQVTTLLDEDLSVCVTSPRGRGPYSLTGRCPKSWTNDGVRTGCEGPVDPASDPNRSLMVTSTLTNVTYKNIYCGQCNEGAIKPGHFHLKFRCEGKNVSSVPEALSDEMCDAHVNETNVGFCEKMEKTITSCPVTWSHTNATYRREVEWRCETYFAPLTLVDKRYKNIFCAICTNSSINMDDVVCRNSYYPIEQEFILQLDGEFGAGTLIPGSSGKLCIPGQVYDPFRKSCRQVMCEKAENCNSTSTPFWADVPIMHSASPCNMTFINSTRFTNGPNNTIRIDDVTYRSGEYESVKLQNETTTSVLLCARSSPKGIPLFPQHFCQRRHLLGYGSCGCESDCVQSRSCCLDAFDDSTVDAFRLKESWVCLNDSRGLSAVAKCPKNFNDHSIRKQCENVKNLTDDPLLHVPVFAWRHSALYRNVFCAVCNGVTNVTFHKLHFLCAEHSKLRNGWQAAEEFVRRPGLCSLEMELKDANLPVQQCIRDKHCRQCPANWASSGNAQEMALGWRCQHFYAPVAINGVCYRNDFCALCNGIVPVDSKNLRTYSDSLLSLSKKKSEEKKTRI
uniref:SMB domain-containing protein n=1 Tax=Strigamia maritima TaxID=126957 RepID=T1J312_STRMM